MQDRHFIYNKINSRINQQHKELIYIYTVYELLQTVNDSNLLYIILYICLISVSENNLIKLIGIKLVFVK